MRTAGRIRPAYLRLSWVIGRTPQESSGAGRRGRHPPPHRHPGPGRLSATGYSIVHTNEPGSNRLTFILKFLRHRMSVEPSDGQSYPATAIPPIGAFRCVPPMEPRNGAL